MMAWLERFSPTPGRSARTSMPSSRRRPAGKIHLVLELAEVGQHVGPAPAVRTVRLPLGIIVGRSAIRDHPHHGRAAAHDTSLQKAHRRGIVFAPPMYLEVGPEIGVVVVGRGIGIEHVGRLFARRRVQPGFEQEHSRARSRRQPVGQHASGRAGANDNGVETVGHAMLERSDWFEPPTPLPRHM